MAMEWVWLDWYKGEEALLMKSYPPLLSIYSVHSIRWLRLREPH